MACLVSGQGAPVDLHTGSGRTRQMFIRQKNEILISEELTCGVATALNNEKAHGVQALACGFKLLPDQENKLKLELHALFPRRKYANSNGGDHLYLHLYGGGLGYPWGNSNRSYK